MNPALRARVERAVSHKARARHEASALGMASPFASRRGFRPARLLPLLTLVVLAGVFAAMAIHDRREIEADRRALLSEIEEIRAGLPAGHDRLIAETERWLVESAAEADAPDLIDPSLRPAGALDAALRRPALYVRASAAELRDARGIDEVARGSD